MSRLFLRFFSGVIAILLAAWLIQGTVLRIGTERQAIDVTEKSLGGGARIACGQLLDGEPFETLDEEVVQARLEEIQSQFSFPVALVESWKLSLTPREKSRLENGEIVLDETGMLLSRVDIDHALRFGPLPAYEGPSQTVVTLGLGLVMLMAAIAIAILLRPVAIPLRAVERTATAISEGDLSARINPRHVPKGLALATAFNTMAEKTESLLRSQKELLEAVSHELRTPLARIRFATDLIETAESAEERKSRLDSVDNATQRLDDLVGELLTYVRLESDANVDEPETIELNDLFEQLVDIYGPLHEGIKFDIERMLPNVHVTADRRSIARAVGNLLSNAGRYAKTRVAIRAIQQRSGVLIQVDDDGVGIPEEDRAKVFDPFVRLTPGDGKGTGLGLALVYRIATRHGGTVVAEESEMGGARFSLYLPHEME